MKKLPIGIQTFSEIREENYVYVDKTALACQLVEGGKYYFLARPRRFGKSLLVSTLQALFEGRKQLFIGLAAETQWDWSVTHPVIKISFGEGIASDREGLKLRILDNLRINYEQFSLEMPDDRDIAGLFGLLIRALHKQSGQRVVVLVDEYDKPILDNIDNPEVARQMREGLRDFYSVIKGADTDIKFAFLTGVSKFSKVSIFSGLNNLEDISLNRDYATLCGYTQSDLETTFAEHLRGADMDQVRQWYNGYNFLGEPVYNPFDILLFIKNGYSFQNYWFATGTPTFLVKLIQKHNYYVPQLENLQASKSLLDSFDIDSIELETILFQAGYLSIKEARQTDFGPQYTLGYPNKEVAISFNDMLIRHLTGEANPVVAKNRLLAALKQADLDEFKETLTALFAAIPYTNYVNNTISSYEGYYASVVYAYLASLGLDIVAEDVTSTGRIDLTLRMAQAIYVVEFKVDGEGKALAQIKAKNYHAKYRTSGVPIYLVGIDFSSTERNFSAFAWERLRNHRR